MQTYIASREIEVGGDGGPAFPPQKKLQLVLIDDLLDSLPSDDDNPSDERILKIKQLLEEDYVREIISKEEGGSLVSRYEEGGLMYKVRSFQGYWVAQAIAIKDDKSDDAAWEAGSIFSTCYYFKKVDSLN